ncbi:hypothetical protein SFC07_12845 [Corynebacterium callunae]
MGKTLLKPARFIVHWALENYSAIEKAREDFDKEAQAAQEEGDSAAKAQN